VLVALIFIGLPFVVRSVQPVLEGADRELEEAAASLGASRWQVFSRVVFPIVRPALLTGFAMAFARALGEYGSVIFISGNMPMRTQITPLLIVAIIGIESGFNPFAESSMGAQGLMQVIPRFHQDKLPEGTGDQPLLDPAINIRVGVDVPKEAIRRRGSLIAGLQYYAGSSETDGSYASKVLAEKDRLEQAARRSAGAATTASTANPAPDAPNA